MSQKWSVGAAASAAVAVLLSAVHAGGAPLDPNAFESLGSLHIGAGYHNIVTSTNELQIGGRVLQGVTVSQGPGQPEISVFTFDDLTLADGATLTAFGPRAVALLSRGNITLLGGATIDLNSSSYSSVGAVTPGGYSGAGRTGVLYGPGTGSTGNHTTGHAGGGHGGAGGNSGGGTAGGVTYGDLLAVLQGGSGGGGQVLPDNPNYYALGGYGGGALELGAVGTIHLGADANINAIGRNNGENNWFGEGGGAGGGVLMHAGLFQLGAGAVVDVSGANGSGNLASSRSSGGHGGGGGGGGLVQLYTPRFLVGSDTVASTFDLSGGAGGAAAPGFTPGAAGTAGELRLRTDTVVIPTGQVFSFPDHYELRTRDVSVQSGGTLLLTEDYRNPGTVTVGSGATAVAAGQLTGGTWQLEGGLLSAPGGLHLTADDAASLRGHGTFHGRLSGGEGSYGADALVSISSKTLTIGDAGRADAIDFDGTITVGAWFAANPTPATLILLDANRAEIGYTVLATGALLSAPNGTLLRPDRYLGALGEASVDGAFTNAGTVTGPTTEGTFLRFLDQVDGNGNFTGNITFAGGYSPGNSPARVSLETVAFDAANVLTMELGGLTPGSDYDQLVISGTATLGGTLELALLGGFAPSYGDSFRLIEGGSLVGEFAVLNLPQLDGGLTWNIGVAPDALVATVVPEPMGSMLLGAGGLLALRRRRC